MLLTEPNATPFDLRFRLFGTYVRVHPMFWLMAVVLGWNSTRERVVSDNGMAELAIWVGCAFFSILLHEFGHVWMGRVFGSHGHILLQGMGGLAIGADAPRSWQRILIMAGGPAIQLALFAGLLLFDRSQNDLSHLPKGVSYTLDILLMINLLWPLLNLLPIWPLDGGQITREVATGISPHNGFIASLWISLVVSGLLAVNALAAQNGKGFIPYAPGSMWMAILFALFAVGSWQALQAVRHTRRPVYHDDALPWER